MPDISFEMVIEAGAWPDEKTLKPFVTKVCAAMQKLDQGQITFVFTNDTQIQALNRAWRHKDKPTNVLSFPDGDVGEGKIVHLGDVIVSHETLVREAKELGISFEDHLTHLLLHGSLHLLGYDHIEEADAEAMESLEIRLLEGMGIKNPYQDGILTLD